ncbi:MAG TPA: class I SAM-dependent methyltransferase [Rhodoblastus sp.]|nr:class I SAM-dependent methyltransferase [Rhodoblastus sp.]
MSGFDPAWLDLREPADHRARNGKALAACAAHFAGRAHMRIVDLGCGLGSNLRALAPHLPARQSWRLVDHDPVLLATARERLTTWGRTAEEIDGALRLTRDGRTIDVEFVQADLSHDAAAALGADLVTAAALFDLVSQDWIERFVARVSAARTPFYTALTYNGVETWSPPDARDADILAAFHAHQGRDKGFGPSVGPRATGILTRLFEAQGYAVTTGESPWRLTRADAALIALLANGVADACAETGLVSAETAEGWRAARAEAVVEIGHLDLFARPG